MRERERGREGEREGGREGEREGGREGGREREGYCDAATATRTFEGHLHSLIYPRDLNIRHLHLLLLFWLLLYQFDIGILI